MERVRVLSRDRLVLAHQETVRHDVELSFSSSQTRQRLVVLLYRGQMPSNLSVADAYRATHVWLDGTSGGNGAGGGNGTDGGGETDA